MNRIVMVSVSGKTTLSRRLETILSLPHVELDRIYHLPGWQEPDLETFRSTVEQIAAGDAWIIDGSYFRRIGYLTLQQADTVCGSTCRCHSFYGGLSAAH